MAVAEVVGRVSGARRRWEGGGRHRVRRRISARRHHRRQGSRLGFPGLSGVATAGEIW
jgi:hypothetical protein